MGHALSRGKCRPKTKQRFTVGDVEYQLGGKIGDGAASVVRKAKRLSDKKTIAVKFLAPDPKYIDEAVFDDVASRFRREGERGAKLDHQSLLRVDSYCANDGGSAFNAGTPSNPILLMEWVRGRTLESYIKSEVSQPDGVFRADAERLKIALHVAEALNYLHKRRIVHRDVKPANIFLEGRRGVAPKVVKLGDFGIVKWGDFQSTLSTGSLTATHHRGLGTLKYCAPEQAVNPKEVTVRADTFALGITLFELFTGKLLPNVHHVYQLVNVRAKPQTTTIARYATLGFHVEGGFEDLAELVLDMVRRGVSGRPAIDRVRGRLDYLYEKVAGEPWEPS